MGEHKETFRDDGYAYCPIVVIVLQVYAYVQTYQIVYIKKVQVFVYQFHFN